MPLYGAIEAGGTKFVCAVGTNPTDLRHEIRFPTTTPTETIAGPLPISKEQAAQEPLQAIGIAAFGPVDPNPASATFGYITTTPNRAGPTPILGRPSAGPLACRWGLIQMSTARPWASIAGGRRRGWLTSST